MTMYNPPHPGRLLYHMFIIDEDGKEIGTLEDMAEYLGLDRLEPTCLERVLRTKGPIMPHLAMLLEKDGHGSAEHWLIMQMNYDLWRLRNKS